MLKREYLIKLREKNGWLQEDVANKTGTTQQTVSLLENGKRNPSIKLAKSFEILFEEPMENLFPDIFLTIDTTKCNICTISNQKTA